MLLHDPVSRPSLPPPRAVGKRHSDASAVLLLPSARSPSPSSPPSYLRKRGRCWWYRRRVPLALREAFGASEATLSLHTGRLRTALRRADMVSRWLSLAFAEAGGFAEAERLGAAAAGVRRRLLVEAMRKRLEELARQWAAEKLRELEEERETGGPVSDGYLRSVLEGFDTVLPELREALALGRVPKDTERLADELLSGAAGEVAGMGQGGAPTKRMALTAEERATFLRLLLRAQVELLEREERRTLGDYSEEPLLGHSTGTATTAEPGGGAVSGPTVAEAIALYVAAHEGKSWRAKMAAQAKVALRYFEEVAGSDTPLRSVGKDDVRRFRSAMEKLPANVGSTSRYRGKTLAEILAMGDPPGLGPGTIKVYVQRNVGGLFNWAKREGYVTSNPAEGLAPKPRSRPRDERDAFTDADLAAIFSADFAKLREDSERPEDWWLPLLLLHSGARNEEAAQLRVADVEEVEGVPCLRLRDDGEDQQLKTATSRRTVPLHPVLLELGFLDYVERIRRGRHERLFPNLRKGSNGFHDAASRRFNRRLRRLGIDGRKTLYSMRHTFATRLWDAGVPPDTISELMGHSHPTMTLGRYAKGQSPRTLLEAVSRLDTRKVLGGLLGATR